MPSIPGGNQNGIDVLSLQNVLVQPVSGAGAIAVMLVHHLFRLIATFLKGITDGYHRHVGLFQEVAKDVAPARALTDGAEPDAVRGRSGLNGRHDGWSLKELTSAERRTKRHDYPLSARLAPRRTGAGSVLPVNRLQIAFASAVLLRLASFCPAWSSACAEWSRRVGSGPLCMLVNAVTASRLAILPRAAVAAAAGSRSDAAARAMSGVALAASCLSPRTLMIATRATPRGRSRAFRSAAAATAESCERSA